MDINELLNANELHEAQLLRARLEELGLSAAIIRILKGRGINTLGDLTSLTREDLLRTRFLGRTNVRRIEDLLETMDLKLKQPLL